MTVLNEDNSEIFVNFNFQKSTNEKKYFDSHSENVQNQNEHNTKVILKQPIVKDKDILRITALRCKQWTDNENSENFVRKYFIQWHAFVRNKNLLKKVFANWKEYSATNISKNSTPSKTEKIENLIEALQKHKISKTNSKNNCSNAENKQEKIKTIRDTKPTTNKESECYKNRFETQKEIIEMQKTKLVEQTKLIEDLKLGIMQDELLQSIKKTKDTIREIFGKSSTAVKCKTIPEAAMDHDELLNLIIKSNKAPKFLQEMEKQALERARKREIISERKRIIDEERKRLAEELVEKKRVQDEDEKKRSLEAIKEKRRLEFEMQKIRQLNKETYLKNLKIAENHYNKKLLRRGMNGFQYNVYIAQNNAIRAEVFCERKMERKYFHYWLTYLDEKYREGFEKSETFYNSKILKKAFAGWKLVRISLFIQGV